MLHVLNIRKKRLDKVQIVPDVMGLKIPPVFSYQFPEREQEELLNYLQDIKKGEFFGIEGFFTKEKQRLMWVSEYQEKTLIPAPPVIFSTQKEDIKHTSLYLALPTKSSMFSFKMDNLQIWEQIQKTLVKYIDQELVYIQVLMKKRPSEKWRQKIQTQYEQYLQGLDEPSDFGLVFKIQQKLNDMFTGEDWKKVEMKPLNSVEQKCNQEGFHTCIRMAIYGKEESRRGYLAEKILREIRKMNDSNEWGLSKVLIKQDSFLQNMQFRRFPIVAGKYTTLCTSEILPWVTCPTNLKEWIFEKEKTEPKIEKTEVKPKTKPVQTHSVFGTLPKGEKQGNQVFDFSIIGKINTSLTKLGILKNGALLDYQSVVHAPTVQRINFIVPQGIKLTQLQNATKDIQTELGVEHMGFMQGHQAGSVTVILPQPKRKVVYLRDWVETEEFAEYIKGKDLPFFIGVTEDGKPLFECLTRVKHLLTAGATGSGKSVWLNQLLLILLMIKSPQELMMYLIDPKMVEFSLYKGFPHIQEVLTEAEESEELLQKLTVEMDKRYELLARHGCRNIQQYNRKAKEKMPYILTVIDEFADLVMMNEHIESHIIRLAQKARACGIHLIIATQRPSVDVITGLLKSNLPSRIVFACSSVHDYKTVLDEKPSMKLLGRGHGVAQLEGKQGLIPFQGAVISLEEEDTDEVIQNTARKLSQKYTKPRPLFALDGSSKEPHDQVKEEEIEEPNSLDRLKLIIAQTGETRVAKLREMLGVKQSTVKELMQQLIVEGWVEAPLSKRSGYKLLFSDEQRHNYLKQIQSEDEIDEED